ncbi:MAG: hypothetical protein IKX23_01735 [Treponema sp.]|nr:hypothetical protein [Treponema sp.]
MKKFSLDSWRRFIPLICSLIFLFYFIYFFKNTTESFLSTVISIFLGISFCISFLLFLFPKHYSIYGIVSFIYSFLFSFFEQYYILMIFSSIITIVFLWNQGFFTNRKAYKYIISVLYFSILCFIRIYKFSSTFEEHLLQFLPYIIFVLIITLFVINSYTLRVGRENKQIINIDKLELTERQKDLIPHILSNKVYKDFADSVYVSESVVKKDAAEIFKYFDVCSRYAFIAKFSHFTFTYKGKTYNFNS